MTLLPPTVEQQERIDQELNWDPEMLRRDIMSLREWLKKSPHLPQHIDDLRLERFLLGCKNNLERTKLLLDRYYSVRTAIPALFAARDPLSNDIQESCKATQFFVLPSLTSEGYRVMVARLIDRRLEKVSIEAFSRRVLMTLDARLNEEFCLSNLLIVDSTGFSTAHVARYSPTQTATRHGMIAIQNSMPFRLARIHFLNVSPLFSNATTLLFPLLRKKLIEKIHFHTGGGEDLYPYIERDILPKEWGGNAGTFEELNDAWKKKIEKYRDWFLREEKISRTVESARLPSSKSSIATDLSGMQGSFRNLNID